MTTNTTPVLPDPTDPLYNGDTTVRDLRRIEEAKRFLKNALWLYDNISERGTRPKNGRRPRMTLRRFAAGAPHGCVREVLDLLTDQAPYIDPIINNDIVPGRWKPKLSWFRKDSGNATVGARTATVTLIQELVPDYAEGEGTTIEAGGNCSTIEEYEYIWDAPEIIGPEAPYPQGVTYSVGGINRDDDSGLFSYYIRKSTAVTQHLGPYVSGSSRANQVVTEVWKNLYELPEDLPQEGITVQDGKEISVEITVNDDCTYNVVKRTSKALEHDSVIVCGKTLTEHSHSITTGGNSTALGEAQPAAGGLVTRHTSRQEDDGTFTNEVQTTQELAVTCHTVTRSKTVNGIQTVVADRNQPSAPSLSGLRIGESVSYSRTDGGLYDTCKVSFTMDEITDRASSRAKTLQQSQCSDTTVQLEKGNESATAEGGVLKEYSYQITELGTWQRTEQTTTEHQVDCALWQRTKSLDGIQVTTRTENAPKACMVDTELALGESVRFDRTPGDLVHITRTSLDKNMESLVINQSDRETLYAQTYSCMEVAVDKLACIGTGDTLTRSGEDGRVVTAQSQLTDVGSYRNTEEIVQERTVEDAKVMTAKTVFGTTVQTVTCSTPNPPSASALKDGAQLVVAKTQGGWYDVTRVEENRENVCWEYLQTQSPFQTVTRAEAQGADEVACSTGYGVQTVSELKNDGKYDNVIVTIEPITKIATTTRQDNADSYIERVETKNATECAEAPEWVQGKIFSTENELNELGCYDTEVTVNTAREPWCAIATYDGGNRIVKVVRFANYLTIPSPTTENWLPASVSNLGSASLDFDRDAYGLYHGRYSLAYPKETNSGGGGGGGDTPPTGSEYLNHTIGITSAYVVPGINGTRFLRKVTAMMHIILDDDVSAVNSITAAEELDNLKTNISFFVVGGQMWVHAQYYTNITILADTAIETDADGRIKSSVATTSNGESKS